MTDDKIVVNLRISQENMSNKKDKTGILLVEQKGLNDNLALTQATDDKIVVILYTSQWTTLVKNVVILRTSQAPRQCRAKGHYNDNLSL